MFILLFLFQNFALRFIYLEGTKSFGLLLLHVIGENLRDIENLGGFLLFTQSA